MAALGPVGEEAAGVAGGAGVECVDAGGAQAGVEQLAARGRSEIEEICRPTSAWPGARAVRKSSG